MYRPSERAARAAAAASSSSGMSPRSTSSDASVTYRKSSSKTVEKASKTRVMPAEGEEEGDDAGAASPSPPLPRLPRVPARTSGRTIHRQSTFGRYHPSRPLPSVTTPVAFVSTPGVGPHAPGEGEPPASATTRGSVAVGSRSTVASPAAPIAARAASAMREARRGCDADAHGKSQTRREVARFTNRVVARRARREPRGSISASTRSLEFGKICPRYPPEFANPRVCCATAPHPRASPSRPSSPSLDALRVARRRRASATHEVSSREGARERRPAGRRIPGAREGSRDGVRRHHLPVHPPRGGVRVLRQLVLQGWPATVRGPISTPPTPARSRPSSRPPRPPRRASTPRATARVLPSVRGFRVDPTEPPRVARPN